MYGEKDRYFIDYLINHLPHCIFWKNKDLVFQSCNKQFAQQFGYDDPQSIVGMTDNDFPWSKKLRNKYINDDKEILTSGKTKLDYEEEQRQSDGSIKTVLVSKVPIFNDNNEIIGVLGIYTDITDRKKAEEYRIKHEAAQKVINFSNLMAGSIAHELRTPLGAIKQQMETLKGMDLNSGKIPKKDRDDFMKNVANRVIKTVDETTYVIDSILKKVRSFASGEIQYNKLEELSITSDVEELLSTYPFKNNEQALVKVSYGVRFKYLGDKVLTSHVLRNLMKNALHAIKDTNKADASITIKTKAAGDFNLLIFRDTATGIPQDFIDRIFNQFETKKNLHGGTGLGLAFCKRVVEDCYNGNITCKSKEGKYTEFVLSFPKFPAKSRQ